MSLRLQIVIAFLALLMSGAIIRMVVKRRISLRYALSWLFLCIVIMVFDIFPSIMLWIAKTAGVELASNMVFIIAIFLLAMRVYYLTVAVSRLSDENKKLVQEMAVLKGTVTESMEDI